MSQHDIAERTERPVTRERLREDFERLGLEAGDVVVVHASMSNVGWVNGGPPAIVDALIDTVTERGTIVMPTYTAYYSDPRGWGDPFTEWTEEIRATMPPYRPEITPTHQAALSSVVECFRNYPGTVRSRHPNLSYGAWGADAEEIVSDHSYSYPLGDGTPLSEVYDRDGKTLMIGTPHYESNSSIHLAECRADIDIPVIENSGPVLVDGEKEWVTYEDTVRGLADSEAMIADFERDVGSNAGTVGEADAKLASQVELVDYAVEWFEQNWE